MDVHLTGKTAAVSGASQGIGLAITELLAAEGMRVAGAARTITPELAKAATATLAVDLATPDGPARFAEHALAEFGGVDLLVNNVGGVTHSLDFAEITDEAWQYTFDLNLYSAVRLTRALLPSLIHRRGVIVNVSAHGARAPIGPVDATAAKAALTAFSRSLAEHLAPHGVRVNTVSPGMTATRMWTAPDGAGTPLAARAGVDGETFMAALPHRAGIVTGRLTAPEQVAAAVAFLASPHAANICGADLMIDGGATKII